MARLRDGSLLTTGPHGAVVFAPGSEPARLPAFDDASAERLLRGDPTGIGGLEAHTVDGEPNADDPVTVARLAQLDGLYAGWIPGFLEREAEALSSVRAAHARRRVHQPPRGALPALPSSVVRRARAIEAAIESAMGSKRRRVVLAGDADGLGLVLAAAGHDVRIEEHDPVRRAWLANERERHEAKERLQIDAGAPEAPQASAAVAVVAAGDPAQTDRALRWACARVRPGGLVAASLRAPWEDAFFETVTASGLRLVEHVREVDFPVVPGGFVVDGAGDLVFFEVGDAPSVPKADLSPAALARACPYQSIDVDELRPSALSTGALERLAELLAACAPAPETMRSTLVEEGREILSWFGTDAAGLTATLARDERHLLVTVMPYRVDLEWALLTCVLQGLGDHHTRVRPLLTGRHGEERIVA